MSHRPDASIANKEYETKYCFIYFKTIYFNTFTHLKFRSSDIKGVIFCAGKAEIQNFLLHLWILNPNVFGLQQKLFN